MTHAFRNTPTHCRIHIITFSLARLGLQSAGTRIHFGFTVFGAILHNFHFKGWKIWRAVLFAKGVPDEGGP